MSFAVPRMFYYLGMILFCRLCVPAMIFAQQPVAFERIELEAEPRTMYINTIIQDERGIFWLGTMGGLVKYDGYSFTTYTHDPEDPQSISNDIVSALMVDNEGTLWIGTNDGRINKFDRMSGSFTRYPVFSEEGKDIERKTVFCLLEDRKNQIWIGTVNDGLKRFDKSTGHIVHYNIEDDSLPEGNRDLIRSLYITSDNRLLVGTLTNGLWEFNREKETFTFLRHMQGSEKDFDVLSVYSFWESMSITVILEDTRGGLWLGSDNGLFYSEDNDGNFIQFEHNPDDPYSFKGRGIAGIAEDHIGKIWIATSDAGLSRYDKDLKRFEHFGSDSSPESLSNDSLTALFRDNLGTIWIGAAGFGLHKYSHLKHNFPYYTRKPNNPNSLSDSRVYSIIEDKNGTVWIGTLVGGLNSFDRQTNVYSRVKDRPEFQDGLRNGTILSLCEDDEGILWVGTVLGLDKLDPSTGIITHFENDLTNSKPFPRSPVRPIYKDRKGTIWLGIEKHGLFKYIPEESRFINYLHDPDDPTSLSHNTVKSIYQSTSAILWIGTEGGGLNKFDLKTETFTSFNQREFDPFSLSDSWIYCIYEDIDGSLWLGTRKGINRFDPNTGKATVYTVDDGLIDNVVYGILPESDHLLWMSTNKGLSRFNTHNKTFENFDHGYGLQNEEFNTGAYFKNRKGELFFGGQKGFHIFRPETIVRNVLPPPIIITSFKVFEEELLLDGATSILTGSELHYDQNYVLLEFAALDYINPAENKYAYMLEGVDRDWINSGTRRFVSYANLAPGDYVFRVKGSNSHGVWNEEGASLKFTILPPYWGTWWFKSLVGLLVAGTLLSAYLLRINSLHRQQTELSRKVEERTKDLKLKSEELEAFGYSVSHDLRTPVWHIYLFGKLLQEDQSAKLNAEGRNQLEIMINSSKSSLQVIEDMLYLSLPENKEPRISSVDLSRLANEVASEFIVVEPDRTVNFDIKENIVANCDERLIAIVLRNLFSNALKFTSSEEEPTIHFYSFMEGGTVYYAVSDNGIGLNPEGAENLFNAFQRSPEAKDYEGLGVGLETCRRIINHHGGLIKAEGQEDVGATILFTLSGN